MTTRCHSRSTGNARRLVRLGTIGRKTQMGQPSLTVPVSGFSYRLYVAGTAASPHPSVRRMLENREYHSPWSTFVCQLRFCIGRQGWRWKAEKLLPEKAAASLTTSSFCYTWEKLVLPLAHILVNTLWCYSALNKDFCRCFKCKSCPCSFGLWFPPRSFPSFAHLFCVLGNGVLAFPGPHVHS